VWLSRFCNRRGHSSRHPVVFVLPPWDEIYISDDERDHTFVHVRVYERLVAWYQLCGYRVAHVPKLTAPQRCDYVLSELGIGDV
jgi:predicted ATPase